MFFGKKDKDVRLTDKEYKRILDHRLGYAYYGLVSYPQYKKIAALVSSSSPNLKGCPEEQNGLCSESREDRWWHFGQQL